MTKKSNQNDTIPSNRQWNDNIRAITVRLRLRHIYEWSNRHRLPMVVFMGIITVLLLCSMLRQHYREDISDFLPLDSRHEQVIRAYQHYTGTGRVVVMFRSHPDAAADADDIVDAIDDFLMRVEATDTTHTITAIQGRIDMEAVSQLLTFTTDNAPYFLCDKDYDRIDSLLSNPDYIADRMTTLKRQMLFPTGNLSETTVRNDPMGLYSPLLQELQPASAADAHYEIYGGYLFAPDRSFALLAIQSPYGTSESAHNAALLRLLEQCADSTQDEIPQVDIQFTGGPVIAVDNAGRIKKDSIIAAALAVLLIVILLRITLRSSRHILLIVVTIAWGALFALGSLALIRQGVSVIVIGVASVIIGIAVNYPLHLIAHLHHTPDIKTTLKEIATPLIVGNITTVGAFLSLVPLQSTALKDLGLFCSLLLIGTILFTLFCLPHLIGEKKAARDRHEGKGGRALSDRTDRLIGTLTTWRLKRQKSMVISIILLTVVFAIASRNTTFDTDISHINYLTAEQRDRLSALRQIAPHTTASSTLFALVTDSTLDGALSLNRQFCDSLAQWTAVADIGNHHLKRFLPSYEEQQRRLEQWNTHIASNADKIIKSLSEEGKRQGFASETFAPFIASISRQYHPVDPSQFVFSASLSKAPLELSSLHSHFASEVMYDSVLRCYQVIVPLQISAAQKECLYQHLDPTNQHVMLFDMEHANSTIATTLSDEFNYIGWACALIVFFFLWFSLGSIELALVSFLPMAVSWVWILGIMALTGIQFNVVNIILASFIFGQGDDYTIFITEGCQYEYAYRRNILPSYRRSILLSALIMFIGIGSLIIARHPALRSLAQITIVGMFSVVMMAWILPPIIYRFLTTNRDGFRTQPLTLRALLPPHYGRDNCYLLVKDRYRYCGIEIYAPARHSLRQLRRHQPPINTTAIAIDTPDWGAAALWMALEHPDITVVALLPSHEQLDVATHRAALYSDGNEDEELPNNLRLLSSLEYNRQTLQQEYTDLQWISY